MLEKDFQIQMFIILVKNFCYLFLSLNYQFCLFWKQSIQLKKKFSTNIRLFDGIFNQHTCTKEEY